MSNADILKSIDAGKLGGFPWSPMKRNPSSEYFAMLRGVVDDPFDSAPRLVMSDWLIDQEKESLAALFDAWGKQGGYVPIRDLRFENVSLENLFGISQASYTPIMSAWIDTSFAACVAIACPFHGYYNLIRSGFFLAQPIQRVFITDVMERHDWNGRYARIGRMSSGYAFPYGNGSRGDLLDCLYDQAGLSKSRSQPFTVVNHALPELYSRACVQHARIASGLKDLGVVNDPYRYAHSETARDNFYDVWERLRIQCDSNRRA